MQDRARRAAEQAEAKARDIVSQAEQKADGILSEARKKADQMLKGASQTSGKEERADETPPAKKTYSLNNEKSDTIVFCCSDPKYQEAFQLFLSRELKLKAYAPLILPGASQLLTFSDSVPKFSTALLRSLRFLVKEQGVKHIVVIMHEDCAWYRVFVPAFLEMKGDAKDQQIQDMVATKRLIQEEFPGVDVRMFYAAVGPEKKVEFSEILEKH